MAARKREREREQNKVNKISFESIRLAVMVTSDRGDNGGFRSVAGLISEGGSKKREEIERDIRDNKRRGVLREREKA